MFAKRLFKKAINLHQHHQHHQQNVSGGVTSEDVDVRTILHYGIPSTASILAFDSIQRLLAIGSLDGRIKVMGGDNIEGLLVSPKQLPFKYLEFLQNQGFLISITNDNEIQVWNLESRCISFTLQWESNITAFSIIIGSHFMYVGDEYGTISVLKYDAEVGELLRLPYNILWGSLQEAAGLSFLSRQLIVGVLPQPCSSGSRVVIAYESGLIVLWDVVEARIISIWGDRVLQLKDEVDSPRDTKTSLEDNKHQDHSEEKEISALCWASSDGSILAAGYVDGDILFWRTSIPASKKSQQAEIPRNVVKLQLSSSEKRIPIIALQWWENDKSRHEGDGHLLVYGGDEIGGDEVVTVLSLEWSSGTEILKCIGRVDLKLSGYFADVILLAIAGTKGRNENAALFVLTNPGKLQVFDCASFSASSPQEEKSLSISSLDFPAVIPTTDPFITAAKLFSLPTDGNLSKALSEIATVKKFNSTSNLPSGAKWSLTGGIPNHLLISKDISIERVYIAGYQNGSVRIWNATYPVLSLLCVIDSEIKGVDIAGSSAPVSKVDICFQTLTIAVGNGSGLVYLHSLSSCDERSFHIVTENKSEVHSLPQVEGPNCRAIFSLLDSRIEALQFSNTGAKLVVGYECARIAVLDTKSFSTLFLTENISSSSSLLVSVVWKESLHSQVKKLNNVGSKHPDDHVEEYIFILTDDAKVYVVNGSTGNTISSRPMHLKKQSTAISMHLIESGTAVTRKSNESLAQHSSKDDVVCDEPPQVGDEPPQDITASESPKSKTEHFSSEKNSSAERQKDSYLLLCCKNEVRVFTIKSVIQGDAKSIYKIKLAKPCCWTTTFTKDDENCGLVLLYQTGDIEIRSLPDLELVREFSLMSALRWNYKANMERTISSTSNGHIVLVNGCEVALVSVLAKENAFRIPEALPSLHDEVLAAAAKAAISVSSSHKKKQGTVPGILGGIVKGLTGGKMKNSFDRANFNHLEGIFMKNPFPDLSPTSPNKQEEVELSIDDIEIDEPVPLASTSSHEVQNNEKEIKSERERLFEDGGTDAKPRVRTREEIIAKYRKNGVQDASSAAGEARNKLLERQEKLERISKRTEELQSGAEDFASLANELVKAMENRKWWQI